MRKQPLLWMLVIALGSHQESVSPPPLATEAEAAAAVTKVDAAAAAPIQQVAGAVVADFRDWAKSCLAALRDQQVKLLGKSEELAVIRIAEMIRLDPGQAIANAVQDRTVALLEKHVRLKDALTVNGNAPLPGRENSPDFKLHTRVAPTCYIGLAVGSGTTLNISPFRNIRATP